MLRLWLKNLRKLQKRYQLGRNLMLRPQQPLKKRPYLLRRLPLNPL
jgi:hypothetical protein